MRHFSIEGYRILRKIGEGGMASIYLAACPGCQLEVLKVMRISDDPGDPLQRFMQEFALLAQTRHPNVAHIHRQGFCAGHAYIAMEYFSEGDLRKRIGAGFDAPTAIFSNAVEPAPSGSYFATCAQPIPASWMNIAPTSIVDRRNEETKAG